MSDRELPYQNQIMEPEQETSIQDFEYQPGRGGKYPEAFLDGYNDRIHTDAYSGHNGIPGLRRVAHSPKGAAASAGIYTLVKTASVNGLVPIKYLKYILSDMLESIFLENTEYLDNYLPWDPMVQERCR